MKQKLWLWPRWWSIVIDISFIYSITILVQAVAWKVAYIPFSLLFVFIFLVYYIVGHSIADGQTPGKRLTNLKVVRRHQQRLSLGRVAVRELLLKGGIGIIIPFYIMPSFFPLWSIAQTAIVFFTIIILTILFWLPLKRPWWELLSSSCTTREYALPQKRKASYFLLLVFATAAIIVIHFPFLAGHTNIYWSYAPAYPVTKETKHSAQFIQEKSEDPVDYIFRLFRDNDIVVLSERIHSEYTQYDLIRKIVSDPRFSNEIGNIFTECGSVSYQDTLSSYLHTRFAKETDLDRQTAILQRNSNAIWPLWTNTNLFDLLKTVNRLNARLPDSATINWYFTDLSVDWSTMTHKKFIAAYTTPDRDSLMAEHIIQPYITNIKFQRRHKALVIMNSRHGYGFVKKDLNPAFAAEYRGTTAFLMDRLPGKVANVMLHSISIKYGMMMTPLQDGKWDRAFKLAGNQDAGFDFKGSPWGNDNFDAAFFSGKGVHYQDVFTGYIFYKPLEQHIQKDGFPFELENFEDNILKRAACIGPDQKKYFSARIDRYHKDQQHFITSNPLAYAVIINIVKVKAVTVVLAVSSLLGLLLLLSYRRQKNPSSAG